MEQPLQPYISIPDPTATSTTLGNQCNGLGLPSLPSGWTYHCSASSTYKNVDGTGWVPVNFSAITYGNPLGILPVDPVNTTSSGNYYSYIPGGSWGINTSMESKNYKLGGTNGVVSKDGGQNDELYEVGSNLTLGPRKTPDKIGGLKLWLRANALTLNNGDAVGTWTDSSGNNISVTQGTSAYKPSYAASAINGMPAVSFDGSNDGLSISSIPTGSRTLFVVANRKSGGHVFSVGRTGAAAGSFDVENDGSTNGWNDSIVSFGVVTGYGTGTYVEDIVMTSGGATFYKNGTSTVSNANAFTLSTSFPGLGGRDLGNGSIDQNGNVDIAEILFYNSALSDADRRTVEYYLNAKYRIY